LYPTEFLNSISANSFPNHKLMLKKGVIETLIKLWVFAMAQDYL
jgi:hypothetical protein